MSAIAVAILLIWTARVFLCELIFTYEPGRAAFDLVLLLVDFFWLQLIALGVVSTFDSVWNRSSHLYTAVASCTFISVTVVCCDVWLYSNGYMQSDNVWECLLWTAFVGASVTLLFGAIVWLTAAVRALIDKYRKVPRSDGH